VTEGDKIKAVAKVLKKHFTNLSVEQTIDYAVEIVEALREHS
jgi:exosome complex RNA-binding protein Rrp42 (RNase PH superfamily)